MRLKCLSCISEWLGGARESELSVLSEGYRILEA